VEALAARSFLPPICPSVVTDKAGVFNWFFFVLFYYFRALAFSRILSEAACGRESLKATYIISYRPIHISSFEFIKN